MRAVAFAVILATGATAGAQPTIQPPRNVPASARPGIPVLLNDVDFGNWDFEAGLDGWTADGTAFAKQPTLGNNVLTDRALKAMDYANNGIGGDYWKGQPYPIGFKGTHWIGTFDARPDARTPVGTTQGDAPTGSLTSAPFKITKTVFSFLIGGSKNPQARVELQIQDHKDGPWRTVVWQSPLRTSEELARVVVSIQAHRGKTARVRIVDESSTAHLAVDDIRFVDAIAPGITVNLAGTTFNVDANAPVWGFADTHAHPAGEQAFGKNVVIGNPGAPLADTYSSEQCGTIHHLGSVSKPFLLALDDHAANGWPDFLGFPRFNGVTHQKYHVEFIKRAWQGGLRLMSAVAVQNMYLANAPPPGQVNNGEPTDDESVMLRVFDEIKTLARANSTWMEIAYEPADARRIIREGKLAIVLGLEADVFGDFKSPDAIWRDRPHDRPLVEITDASADRLLDAKLAEYERLGLRQVLPVHYLGKPFGATAIFNGATLLPQFAFYQQVNVKSGVPRGVTFNAYDDYQAGASLVGSQLTPSGYTHALVSRERTAPPTTVNADGLTPIGTKLLTKLMERHFIIDVEHGSYETKDGIFQISAAHGNYPVIASHVDPLGLAFGWQHAPLAWGSLGGGRRIAELGTSNIRNLGHEMELSNDNYAQIHARGGTVGVFLTLNRKRAYTGSLPHVADACAGSTTTFAQMYLHSLDLMGGHGVALASDLPMVEALSPRFGPFACWALEHEAEDSLKKDERQRERLSQVNGVRYDRPSRSFQPALFEFGDIDRYEEDVYKALAAWSGGATLDLLPSSTDALHRDRIRNLYKGLIATSADQLARPSIGAGDGPAEQAVTFALAHPTASLAGLPAEQLRRMQELDRTTRPVFAAWAAKDSGPNQPLRRLKTGNRDWDYNVDGLAHYGLIPDMLQDLKNVGVSTELMTPLFQSAEDYIEAWERAKAARP